MKRQMDPKYLKKNLGKPLTEDEVIVYQRKVYLGQLDGVIHRWRGNYYFIPDHNGSKKTRS